MRTFQRLLCWQALASSGLFGQVWPGRHMSHARNPNSMADSARVQYLYWAIKTRPLNCKFKLDITAPNPRDTSTIGKAQHTRVVVVKNKVNQPK